MECLPEKGKSSQTLSITMLMSSSLSLSVLVAETAEAMVLGTTARILIKMNSGNGQVMDKETTMIIVIQTAMITGTITVNILATCHIKIPVIIRNLASLNMFRSQRHKKNASRNASRKSSRRSNRSVNRRNSKSFLISIKAKNKAARWISSR